AALVSDVDILGCNAFDTALAAYVLNSSAGKYPLSALAETYLDTTAPEARDDKEVASVESQIVASLVPILEQKLDVDGTAKVYREIDLPLVGVLAMMERNGAPVDTDALAELGASTQLEIDGLKARIYELAGEEFNVDSPKQLGHILFEVLELPHGKKTKSGYSTDAQVLKKLSEIHELPATVIHYREFAKIKSTYIDALPNIARRYGDGRVHTSFNETVTSTGRLSSSDPNLQNIPVRTDFGRKIRACFGTLRPGDKFLSADYSQIELRLLAHLSGDEHLVAAFNSGADFHASTAARVFDVPIDEVTPQMRSRAKAVNFGIVYGQQAFGLAQSLEIPMYEAKEMIDRYFEAYPGVRAYLDRTVREAKEKGYAETMFGRRRHIPELSARNAVQRGFGERTAMNHPMQGSAADIIKMAMNEVARRLVDENFEARLLLQVHDELDFSVPEDELERLSEMVKDVMENVAKLSVPLIADVSWGDTWAEAH
ncbi:MAG: DNA polymerase I, partial [Eggerthellaceae bacterium]|nr:DNA polymerase I [Eggerthellaceae bacterium]